MKKLDKPLGRDLPPTKLFLDDIIEIIDILKTNSFEDINLILEGYEFTPDELEKVIKKINTDHVYNIKITARNPYFTFEIRDNFCPEIYVADSSAKAVGVVKLIEEIVTKNKRLLYKVMTNDFFYSLIGALTVLFGLGIGLLITKLLGKLFYLSESIKGTIIIGFIFFLLIVGLKSTSIKLKPNLIILKKKSDVHFFWERNRDYIFAEIIIRNMPKLVLLIIGGLIYFVALFMGLFK